MRVKWIAACGVAGAFATPQAAIQPEFVKKTLAKATNIS
jgi:hypothetical protein